MAFSKEERDELRLLHAAATAGEWHYDDGVTDGEWTANPERGKPAWITTADNTLIAEPAGDDDYEPCHVPTLAEMDANGKCIVAAHNTLIPLLDALDAAEAGRDEHRAIVNASTEAFGLEPVMSLPGAITRLRAERDALKAKLAALVEVVERVCNEAMPCGQGSHFMTIDVAEKLLVKALAAAKVQP